MPCHTAFSSIYSLVILFLMIVLFCLGIASLGIKRAGHFIRCLFLYPHFRCYHSWCFSYWYWSRSAILGGGTTKRYFRNHEHVHWIIVCNQWYPIPFRRDFYDNTSIYLCFCPISWTQLNHPLIIRWWWPWATVDLLRYLKKKCCFLMENRIQTCFHDRTGCKIHRGWVLMDKYTQIVPWSKHIVQRYDITCFRANVYRAHHKTLRWISILVATFNVYMHCLQSNRSYFIPVLYVYINKRKKHPLTVFHKYI